MNTVADDTLYRIKQDVRTRYGMKSYSTEDDNTKRQMLDDLEFLINENKVGVDAIGKLIKYLNGHIVNIPDWIEEIADEYGIELE